MNKVTMAMLSAGLLLGAFQPAIAADGTADASRGAEASQNSLRKLGCDHGDPVVLLNTRTNQYTRAAVRSGANVSGSETAGSRTDVNRGSLASGANQQQGQNEVPHVSSPSDFRQECMSKAVAAGATMSVKGGSLLNSRVGAGGH